MKRIAAELKLQLKTTFLPAGLHDKPKELQSRLQAAIDAAENDKECCRIVVGYGICGRGTVGIRASSVPLVFPRVHDCIALFLGSDQAYKREFAKYPGTFYLTAGWQLAKLNDGKEGDKTIWIGSEAMGCQALRERYGERGAGRIIDFFSSWQKNYQRAVFIDTGLDPSGRYARQAREMAEEHHWRYEKIAGDDRLLRQLLTREQSGESVIVVPPGHCTIYSALTDGLDCAPVVVDSAEPLTTVSPVSAFLKQKEIAHSTGVFQPRIRYGLGVDAGGTYTDAVIYDFHEKIIRCKSKALTTKWDFSIGIDQALAGLDQRLLTQVEMVSVSTTLATNAIVEGQGQKVGLIVLGNSSALIDNIQHSPKRIVHGYIDISGQEIIPVDDLEVQRVVREMAERDGVCAFAVSGFAGAVNPIHELRLKKIIELETGMSVCCGHELSDLLDFTVRAQTAVLNARIIPLMIRFFGELDRILKQREIFAPVMVVKGDGTLMSAEMARERPVETILSGPAASVAGAKLLTGLGEAMVVDMGGTTSDIAEIRNGSVATCGRGARVGDFNTHVKALDMRTIGLGGDSLIRWKQNQFTIGPRRVVPLVYAGNLDSTGVDKVLSRLDKGNLHRLEQVFFLPTVGPGFSFSPTPGETRIIELLRSHPHTPEELATAIGLASPRFLSMERLEESGLVRRCGLTPTDVLHAQGTYRHWNPAPARKMIALLSDHSKKSGMELVENILETVTNTLAIELLRHLILKDCKDVQEVGLDITAGNQPAISTVAQHLLRCILEPSKSHPYAVKTELHIPVIGVGAPVGFFLPGVQRILNTRISIPPDGDVANAVGAVTSLISICRRLVIRPDGMGEFVIEGIAGTRRFRHLDGAQDWAVKYLHDSVRSQGRKAGTSNQDVHVAIEDSVVNTARGVPLFLERVITARLTGNPDIVCRSDMSSPPDINSEKKLSAFHVIMKNNFH
jgi:N-methylhydantoinase A/oxoprolinase/acetone carboxylase beta subunit